MWHPASRCPAKPLQGLQDYNQKPLNKYQYSMAKIKVYLDTRASKDKAPLKLSISHKNTTALLPLGLSISPEHWSKEEQTIIKHPRRQMFNSYIQKKVADIELFFLTRKSLGLALGKNATELRELIKAEFFSHDVDQNVDEPALSFISHFEQVANKKHKKTSETYKHTIGRVRMFDKEIDSKGFDDISKDWLERFGLWCEEQGSSTNTIAIHYRNMRSVFNDAIDNELTQAYPFRRFKIKTIKTAKRSLTIDQLRSLFTLDVDDTERKHLDIFKLIFFLMGINIIDLANLKEITIDGRIEFNRSKTKRYYSMKVEPEAMEIIERYRGTQYLLNILERWSSHEGFRRKVNKSLQRLGGTEVINSKGKKNFRPLFPELTTYWARHTWASIASSLDIPKETIAQALGHGGNSVTDIYIDFDRRKVDEANRKVIDYVLYGER